MQGATPLLNNAPSRHQIPSLSAPSHSTRWEIPRPPLLPGPSQAFFWRKPFIRRAYTHTPKSRKTTTIVSASAAELSTAAAAVPTAAELVREFYDGINRRDLTNVGPLIAEDCVYEDLIFSSPFVGRKAIQEFFKKFTEYFSSDLQFIIDDISGEDSLAVGVSWHLEWQGKPFPFSKGCSFYRFDFRDGKKQIVYGRDCVEPAIKPGETALVGTNQGSNFASATISSASRVDVMEPSSCTCVNLNLLIYINMN